jgi:hypothetical protein
MVLRENRTRLQWSLKSSEGISFSFDGVPFLCVGTVNYQCHQGNDIDLKTKIRRQEALDKNEVKMTEFILLTRILHIKSVTV